MKKSVSSEINKKENNPSQICDLIPPFLLIRGDGEGGGGGVPQKCSIQDLITSLPSL